jgi:hypothetical protein
VLVFVLFVSHEALRCGGLKEETTCLVDIISFVGVLEGLHEDGSTMLIVKIEK